jgi:hypothetical protein
MFVVAVTAACSGSSVTGPTTSRNAELIVHFDSLAPSSPPFHAFHLADIAALLANGSPVGVARIRLNGATAVYSTVGQYDVTDLSGAPRDSALVVLAWRGADADTIVLLEFQSNGFFAELTTTDGLVLDDIIPSSGTALASAPRDTCTSFLSALPPNTPVIPPVACNEETITASATGVLASTVQRNVSFTLAKQDIAAIRFEYAEPVP